MEKTLHGWVNNVKRVGKIIFFEVIDNLSLKPVTVVIKKGNEDLWNKALSVKIGCAIEIKGFVPKKIISKRGREIHATNIVILSSPLEPLPIDVTGKTGAMLDTYIDYRYIALRLPKFRAIFKIRAGIVRAAREFLENEGFIEIHTPKIAGAGAEGGATVFTLKYFEKTAFLSQSPQLYKQMMIASLPRVYEITPYFRAEKFNTPRHLNESWGIDVEMGFIDSEEDVMILLEKLIRHIFSYVIKNYRNELEILGRDKIKIPSLPFPRLTYDEVLSILEEKGLKIKWGEDLDSEAERTLGDIMAKRGHEVYFITKYPWSAKPFYIMCEKDISRAFDLDYIGLELASGGQREHRYDVLKENMIKKGLDPQDFSFYTEAFKFGMPPHGGFGLGLDRLTMVVVGAANIREVVLFPRDRTRLIP